jgi:hypothetical protein
MWGGLLMNMVCTDLGMFADVVLDVIATEGSLVGLHFGVGAKGHEYVVFLPILDFCDCSFSDILSASSLHQRDVTHHLHSIQLLQFAVGVLLEAFDPSIDVFI